MPPALVRFAGCVALALGVLLAAPGLARADGGQATTVTATVDAVVRVEAAGGAVTVVGWSRPEVGVKASSGEVTVEASDGGSRVTVRTRRHEDATLEVSVPAGATVNVRTVHAGIKVQGVTGAVQVESVDGDSEVGGSPGDVEARSVSGRVKLALGKADVRATSVTGDLQVHLPGGGTAALRSVSGGVHLDGAHLARVEIRSVAGNVELASDLQGAGPFVARTHSGDVHVVLPRGATTVVDARSTRGRVDGSDAGAAVAAAGRAVLQVYSFSGSIDVVRK